MSWHLQAKAVDADDVMFKLDVATPDDYSEEVLLQVEQAKELALKAASSGEWGNGPFNIVLSGHRKLTDADQAGNTLSITIHSKT